MCSFEPTVLSRSQLDDFLSRSLNTIGRLTSFLHTRLKRNKSNGLLFPLEEGPEYASGVECPEGKDESLCGRQDSVEMRRQMAAAKRMDSSVDNYQDALEQIAAILAPTSFAEHKLFQDASRQAEKLRSDSGLCCVAELALRLGELGYAVAVRKVLNYKDYWAKPMVNMYLSCKLTNDGHQVEYIIDPNFRELFRIACMTESYRGLWENLPESLVTQPCQLVPVIHLVCEEVEISFLEAGKPLPPWRGSGLTLQRWLSDSYVDLEVPHNCESPSARSNFVTSCTQLNTTSQCAAIALQQHRRRGQRGPSIGLSAGEILSTDVSSVFSNSTSILSNESGSKVMEPIVCLRNFDVDESTCSRYAIAAHDLTQQEGMEFDTGRGSRPVSLLSSKLDALKHLPGTLFQNMKGTHDLHRGR